MRILHISTRLILGGSQENTVLSCEGQSRLGHEVHLAFGPIYGPEGSLLARVEAFNERAAAGEEVRVGGGACAPIGIHVVPSLVREVSPRKDRRCLAELRELIARLAPDVVHTHSSKAGILGRIASFRRPLGQRNEPGGAAGDAPGVVHTIHGPPFMPVDGFLHKRIVRRLNNAIYTLAERYAARRCHVIVSVADAMTRDFLARGIGRPEQYVTVRSGMEVDSFLTPRPGEAPEDVRRELGIAPDDFVVGTVARLAEHKGHDDLLDAIGDDLRANPSWKLLWVGNGWWRERLLARARGLGLGVRELDAPGSTIPPSAQVLVTGLVPPERIPAMLRAMDVLAHPSAREGLPRTVPQALLCGVCPVAYDVDGTGEACRDGVTGRLVPAGDVARLREAIRWCAANPAERQGLAARGKEECRTAFSAATMVRDLQRVYVSAIAAARARSSS